MRVSRLPGPFAATLAGLLLAALPLAGAVSFVQPLATSWTTVPTDTSGLAVADFDADGVLDIAVCLNAGGGGKGIAVMLGNGGASYQAPWFLSTMPDDPVSLLARDFDGDGVVDLVTTFPGKKTVAFLKGRGDGTLESPRSFAVLNTAWIVQTADLNGDTKLDLITGDSEGTVEVLFGNGDGTFLPPTSHSVGALPQDLAIADLDGTNGPDIVAGAYTGTCFSVLLNGGSGTFPATGTNTSTTLQVRGLQVADFDGDLKKDVLVFGEGGAFNVGLFLGNGDGTFQPRVFPDGFVTVEGRPTRYYSENFVVDLDGDGKPDVVLPRIDTNFVTVGYGNGDGTFRWREYVASSGLGTEGAFRDGDHPHTVAFGDMDGDGRLDVVVGRRVGGDKLAPVSILLGTPTGFVAPRSYPLSMQWSQASLSLVAGDFNEDGNLDLLTITDALELVPGTGDGTFGTSTRALGRISGSGEFYNTLRSADLDKDDHLDAVFLATDGVQAGPPPRILVAFGSGSGTLPSLVVLYPADPTAGPRNAVLADFNGDTFPDLAVLEAGASGSVDIFLNNQNRTFTLAAGPPTVPSLGGYGLVAADFDKDGKQDLVLKSAAPSQILFFKGKGDGTFESGVSLPGDLLQVSDFAAGDLNGDGKLDLVAVSGWGYPTSVWLGNGNGTFQAPATYDHGGGMGSSQVVVADLDADGKLDLGIANNLSFAILPGKGDGTFSPRQPYAVGRTSPCVAVGDFNKDGKPDVAVTHPSNGQSFNTITLLVNDSGPRTSLSITKTQTPNPAEVGQVVTYTISAANAGPDAATDVVVRDPLRRDFAFLTATPSAGTCSHTPTLLTCTLGTLAPSATATVTVTAMALKIGYLANTASVTSGVADLNLADNGAAAGQSVTGGMQIFGPGRVAAGDTHSFSIRWINTRAVALQDGIVLAILPPDYEYVDSSAGGLFHGGRNHVFWKLGSVPPFAHGNVWVRIRVRWGVAPHTAESFAAVLGWSSPAGSPFDLSDYLTYIPRVATAVKRLSAGELGSLIASDPDIKKLFDFAISQGFEDHRSGDETTLSDGTLVSHVKLIRAASGEVASVVREDTTTYLETRGADSYGISDDTGGLAWKGDSLQSRPFGDWAAVHSRNRGACINNCIATNLGGLAISQFSLSLPTNIQPCVDCFTRHDLQSCAPCLDAIGTGGAGTYALNLKQCKSDCDLCIKDPVKYAAKCYTCSAGETFKFCGPLVYKSNDGSTLGVYTAECRWTPFKDWSTFEITGPSKCDACAPPEIQVCVNGVCSCVCPNNKALTAEPPGPRALLAGSVCDVNLAALLSEAITANDPNAKSGPAGDVVAGQRLDYAVDYENIGAGTAYAVYIRDELSDALDAATLSIGEGGTYLGSTRTVVWNVGDVPPGGKGRVHFSVNVRADATAGTEIGNVARIIFPSVPQVTPTNPVVSVVRPLVAVPDRLTTPEGVAIPILLVGRHPTGQPLTFRVTVPPMSGVLSGMPPNVTYTPAPGFDGLDQFRFTVESGLSESLPADVVLEVTPSAADTAPPRVVTTVPALGDALSAPQTPASPGVFSPQIRATFDEPLDPASVHSAALSLAAGGARVTGTVDYDGMAHRIVFTPTQALSLGTEYAATVSGVIKDSSGNAMGRDYIFTFRIFGAGAVNADPAVGDFGQTGVNVIRTMPVWMVNTGSDLLTVSGHGLTGSTAFGVVSNGCTGLTIVPLGRCAITVAYTPPAFAPDAGMLTVSTSAGTLDVSLAGVGVPVGGKFFTLAPCRVLDTRDPVGPRGGPTLEAGGVRTLTFASVCGIPATAKSISANVTVTNTGAPGYLTAWPADGTMPLASTVNFLPGQTRANNAVLPLSADGAGQLKIFNGSVGTLDVIVDVNGYFE